MLFSKILYLSIITVILASCGATFRPDQKSTELPGAFPTEFPRDKLENLSYTLVDPSLRIALTDSSLDFLAKLNSGIYELPSSMRIKGYERVRADFQHIAYGDVNDDGISDAVFPLIVERKDDAILEIAAVRSSGSTLRHFASFPLGIATLNSLSITNGKIRVNFVHQVAGDPGPRNTELLLEIPKNAP